MRAPRHKTCTRAQRAPQSSQGPAVPLEEGQVLHCGSADPTCQLIITPTPGDATEDVPCEWHLQERRDEGWSEKSAPPTPLLLAEPPILHPFCSSKETTLGLSLKRGREERDRTGGRRGLGRKRDQERVRQDRGRRGAEEGRETRTRREGGICRTNACAWGHSSSLPPRWSPSYLPNSEFLPVRGAILGVGNRVLKGARKYAFHLSNTKQINWGNG